MKLDLTVAGHRCVIDILPADWEVSDMFGNYLPFKTKEKEVGKNSPVFVLKVEDCPQWQRDSCFSPLYVVESGPEEPRLDIYSNADGEWWAEMAPVGNMPPVAALSMNPDCCEGRLFVGSPRFGRFAADNAAMLMFAFCTSCKRTIEMHASVIVKDEKAYMFIAKSGTGKSTHSRMWLENIPGSRLLNDDNPIVRIFGDGSVKVFGSPWSGKTPCYRNESADMGGIVRIRRSMENRLTGLGPVEAYAAVNSSTSGLRHVEKMADGLYETISQVALTVPCYVLDCRPDAQAAEVCYNGVCKN